MQMDANGPRQNSPILNNTQTSWVEDPKIGHWSTTGPYLYHHFMAFLQHLAQGCVTHGQRSFQHKLQKPVIDEVKEELVEDSENDA
jgi:hypothetical protein